MTVVDSSAFVAVLRSEPDADRFVLALEQLDPLFMSAGTLLEVGTVVLHKRGTERIADMFELVATAQIGIVPVSEEQARAAIDAYGRFGKCTRHPAQLNYGDCFSYALAKTSDLPLLYKGDDFAKTDIRSAL